MVLGKSLFGYLLHWLQGREAITFQDTFMVLSKKRKKQTGTRCGLFIASESMNGTQCGNYGQAQEQCDDFLHPDQLQRSIRTWTNAVYANYGSCFQYWFSEAQSDGRELVVCIFSIKHNWYLNHLLIQSYKHEQCAVCMQLLQLWYQFVVPDPLHNYTVFAKCKKSCS